MSHLINKINISPFWQQLQWVVDPVGYMGKAVKQYPDIFTSEIIGFGNSLLFVNEPQAIQQILTNDRKQFCAPGELNEILKPVLGSNSVIMIDGDSHRKRRQVVMPSFHGARMQNYGQIIFEITNKAFQDLLAQKRETPAGVNFLAREVMQEISMQIILQAVFGVYRGERSEQLRYLMTQMTALFSSPFTSAALFFKVLQTDLGAWSPWGNFIRQKEQLDQLIYQEISERRANHDPERTDILTMLLSAIDEEGNGMSDLELHDELLALLFAGHETTATAMSWALYWVHHLPEVKTKILQELKTLSDPHDWMSIFRLPYLTAVCNETLRIHPVAMLTFPRVAEESVNILGHQIEPKTIVVGCIYLLHQRPDLYPEPTKFKPERFLERQYSSYEFMPFGGGVRRCVGEALAQFEMKIVLATILANYDVNLCDRKSVKPQRRGVTLAPAGGVRMILR